MKNIPLRNIIAAALLAANASIYAGPFDIPSIPQPQAPLLPLRPLKNLDVPPRVDVPKPVQASPKRLSVLGGDDRPADPALKDSPRPVAPSGQLAVTGDDEGCIPLKPRKPIRPIPLPRPLAA